MKVWSVDCRTLALAGRRRRHPRAAHDERRLRLGAPFWDEALTPHADGYPSAR